MEGLKYHIPPFIPDPESFGRIWNTLAHPWELQITDLLNKMNISNNQIQKHTIQNLHENKLIHIDIYRYFNKCVNAFELDKISRIIKQFCKLKEK